ncbi:MAG: peptidoglycan-binding domain-containing protein [Patescibacteria group bacterium]
MGRHNTVLATIVVAMFMPFTAGAITTDEALAQIAALIAQITKLQEQITLLNASSGTSTVPTVIPVRDAVPVAPGPVCPALTRPLSLGATGSDVRSLQSFLLSQEYLNQDGVTGYFGAMTESAVKLWQKNKGIASSGTPSTTGWGSVGAQTRSAIFASCDPGVPQNDKLSLTERGLAVTIDTTVNAQRSCKAMEYTLDYGDGSLAQKIFIPAGACRPLQQTFAHTYRSGGRYTIVLSSGTSRINGPITLVAPPSCSAPVFATDDVPAGAVGEQWTFPLLISLNYIDNISVNATGTPPGIVLATTTTGATSTGNFYRSWILTGIPKASGTYNMILNARNFCGTTSHVFKVQVATTSPMRRCTTISCASGYHASGPLCEAYQTCIPN